MNDVISQINHIKESLKTGIEVEAQSLLFQKLIEIIELQQRKKINSRKRYPRNIRTG